MVQSLEDLVEKKVSVMLVGGPKGIVKIKGTVTDANNDEGLITLETESGGIMGGGKKKRTVFFAYSILGIEIEL